VTAKSGKPARVAAEKRGLRAETIAVWLLRLKGFRIVARRYRSPAGEIDLIARRFGLLVFVEVKARANATEAAWSITPRQQQRISRAAEHYLATNPAYLKHDVRFDAILVTPGGWPKILTNAWQS
jgi:putative endonuclease